MAVIKILAGDLEAGDWCPTHSDFFCRDFNIKPQKSLVNVLLTGFGSEIKLAGNIDRVEIMTEENKKKMLSTAAWGAVGALAIGPVGLLAGALSGGNKKEITFACYLKDGRKFMGTTDSKTYTKLQSLCF
ncbi:MAG: hypothetical protein ACOY8P_10455 [Thermodesulfobacteriota bacterium]